MNPKDILLLGLKCQVTAVSRSQGTILWSTKLSSGMGTNFITLLCDAKNVFAYSAGHLHCLDLFSGRLLWKNELPGYGYGLASLCLPEGGFAPDPAAVQMMMNAQAAAAAVNPAAATS